MRKVLIIGLILCSMVVIAMPIKWFISGDRDKAIRNLKGLGLRALYVVKNWRNVGNLNFKDSGWITYADGSQVRAVSSFDYDQIHIYAPPVGVEEKKGRYEYKWGFYFHSSGLAKPTYFIGTGNNKTLTEIFSTAYNITDAEQDSDLSMHPNGLTCVASTEEAVPCVSMVRVSKNYGKDWEDPVVLESIADNQMTSCFIDENGTTIWAAVSCIMIDAFEDYYLQVDIFKSEDKGLTFTKTGTYNTESPWYSEDTVMHVSKTDDGGTIYTDVYVSFGDSGYNAGNRIVRFRDGITPSVVATLSADQYSPAIVTKDGSYIMAFHKAFTYWRPHIYRDGVLEWSDLTKIALAPNRPVGRMSNYKNIVAWVFEGYYTTDLYAPILISRDYGDTWTEFDTPFAMSANNGYHPAVDVCEDKLILAITSYDIVTFVTELRIWTAPIPSTTATSINWREELYLDDTNFPVYNVASWPGTVRIIKKEVK